MNGGSCCEIYVVKLEKTGDHIKIILKTLHQHTELTLCISSYKIHGSKYELQRHIELML